MRFFRISVGKYVIVNGGNYPLPVFDMNSVFIKAFGYERCRIYGDRKSPIASFKLDSLPPNGHLFLRSYMKSDSGQTFKKLVFVLSPRWSDWKIINATVGLFLRKDQAVTFKPREFVNCTAEKIQKNGH